ncbi:uncharacterized protein LOC132205262 [Neocloeon triangulifer]|uniref:uncharacterized protein LOC132205262 n=1 Tax=Neocloeon triangulifer TaxID=2078957 RepID=UPI00286EC88B|nr:uncharacterized protein LOC132205262 [Neocloeon triangulifer]
MAILQTCCCWHSVRAGSYASAAYTMTYFSLISMILYMILEDEDWGRSKSKSAPTVEGSRLLATVAPTNNLKGGVSSFLEPEGISQVSVWIAVAVLTCALTGILSSVLLIAGLYTDRRSFLVPWVFNVMGTSAMDLCHTFYLLLFEKLEFNPLTGIVLTLDFFLLSLNVYCLLCVISQYQEYKAGRGTAYHQQQPGSVRYVAQPSATTFVPPIKTKPIIRPDILQAPSLMELRPSPNVSPTVPLAPAIQNNGLQSDVPHRVRSVKRVQFPDASESSI